MTLSEYAKMFVGKAYEWGGDGHGGFDCSGLVLECLWGLGLYKGSDTTAQGLRNWLKVSDGWERCVPTIRDSVLFFGRDYGEITHCAISLGDFMVEAGGGGKSSSSGMVRIRPLDWRRDFVEAWKRVD